MPSITSLQAYFLAVEDKGIKKKHSIKALLGKSEMVKFNKENNKLVIGSSGG